jgi:hypothetical protein
MSTIWERPIARPEPGTLWPNAVPSSAVCGDITILDSYADVTRDTDAFIMDPATDPSTNTYAVNAGTSFMLSLSENAYYGLSVSGPRTSNVRIAIEAKPGGVLYTFVDGATALPWAWTLGQSNPLFLPARLGKRYLRVTADKHDLWVHCKLLHFAKGRVPFSLGTRAYFISLDHSAAGAVDNVWAFRREGEEMIARRAPCDA